VVSSPHRQPGQCSVSKSGRYCRRSSVAHSTLSSTRWPGGCEELQSSRFPDLKLTSSPVTVLSERTPFTWCGVSLRSSGRPSTCSMACRCSRTQRPCALTWTYPLLVGRRVPSGRVGPPRAWVRAYMEQEREQNLVAGFLLISDLPQPGNSHTGKRRGLLRFCSSLPQLTPHVLLTLLKGLLQTGQGR